MKQDIHPVYNEITVTCACGNTFQTKSTLKEITVEICSQCHPYYTGKQKLVDTAKRVDKFEELMKKSAEVAKSRKGKKAKEAKRKSAKEAAGK